MMKSSHVYLGIISNLHNISTTMYRPRMFCGNVSVPLCFQRWVHPCDPLVYGYTIMHVCREHRVSQTSQILAHQYKNIIQGTFHNSWIQRYIISSLELSLGHISNW